MKDLFENTEFKCLISGTYFSMIFQYRDFFKYGVTY